jgi:Tfp pilus assembly protein PilO
MKSFINVLFLVFAAYIGYDYWSYTTDETSEYGTKVKELETKKADVATREKKVTEAKEFFRALDKKRAELRALSQELATMKSTLTESLDTPTFMKLVLTEAKRVGLNVTSLSPQNSQPKQYYSEYPFDISYQGVYVQLIAFLDRLAQSERIVRIDDFSVKPKGNTARASKFVDLEGSIRIRSFVYRGTEEDSVATEGGSDKIAKPPATGPNGKPLPNAKPAPAVNGAKT